MNFLTRLFFSLAWISILKLPLWVPMLTVSSFGNWLMSVTNYSPVWASNELPPNWSHFIFLEHGLSIIVDITWLICAAVRKSIEIYFMFSLYIMIWHSKSTFIVPQSTEASLRHHVGLYPSNIYISDLLIASLEHIVFKILFPLWASVSIPVIYIVVRAGLRSIILLII